MIRSFKDKRTEAVMAGETPKGIDPKIVKRARLILIAVDGFGVELDVWRIPGAGAKKLGGDRAGQRSLRVNDQWRICYRWTGLGPADVELTNYH